MCDDSYPAASLVDVVKAFWITWVRVPHGPKWRILMLTWTSEALSNPKALRIRFFKGFGPSDHIIQGFCAVLSLGEGFSPPKTYYLGYWRPEEPFRAYYFGG